MMARRVGTGECCARRHALLVWDSPWALCLALTSVSTGLMAASLERRSAAHRSTSSRLIWLLGLGAVISGVLLALVTPTP